MAAPVRTPKMTINPYKYLLGITHLLAGLYGRFFWLEKVKEGDVLLSNLRYFYVLQGIEKYFEVFLCTTMYFNVL